MKRLLTTALGLSLSLATGLAQAAPESPFHVGVILGESTLDIQSHDYDARDCDEPLNNCVASDFEAQDSQKLSILITGGYSFLDWLALELQYTNRLQADEVYGEVRNSITPGVGASDYSTLEVTTSAAGVFAVFQAGTEVFAKARFGVGTSMAKFTTDFADESYTTTHLAYGLSVGQQFGLGSFELIFMHYPDIRISRPDFQEVFYGADGSHTGVTVRRNVNNEFLGVGYLFTF